MKAWFKRAVSWVLTIATVFCLLPTLKLTSSAATYAEGQWNGTEGLIPDGIYHIVSAADQNYALEIAGRGKDDGTNLSVWWKGERDSQNFYIQRIQNTDYVAIRNINSMKYLDVAEGTTNVQQYGDNFNHINRQWRLHRNADGTYSFEAACHGGMYMDVAGGVPGDGVNVQIFSGNGSAAQKFYLIPGTVCNIDKDDNSYRLTPGVYTIYAGGSSGSPGGVDYAIDVDSDPGMNDGANVQVWQANGGDNQLFDIQPDGEGYYTIQSVRSGRFLSTAGGGLTAGTNVHQWNTKNDDSKWAIVPIEYENTYYIISKRNSLYLDRAGGGNAYNGQNLSVWFGNQGEAQQWYLEAHTYQKGEKFNGDTGVQPDGTDFNDTISLPIKIYDYPADGMLFEYAEAQNTNSIDFDFRNYNHTYFKNAANTHTVHTGNNRAFGMLRGSNGGNSSYSNHYDTRNIGKIFYTSGNWPTYDENTPWWNDRIFQVTTYSADASVDMNHLSDRLGYSLYNTMTAGLATIGLVKPSLKIDGENRMPEYNDAAVTYIADVLQKTLPIPEYYWDDNATNDWVYNYNYVQGDPSYGNARGFGSEVDFAGILRYVLKTHNNNCDISNVPLGNLSDTLAKKDRLVGSWGECWPNIYTYTDAAYFMLNSLFVKGSYNVDPAHDYKYLNLAAATLNDGRRVYVFDAGFTTTVSARDGNCTSAVVYDTSKSTISNSSMAGKAQYCYGDGASYLTTQYPFLPIRGDQNVQNGTVSPYYWDDGILVTDPNAYNTYKNRNFNYVLQSNGEFVYYAEDGLFFDFEGDDDVYLYINGQLVLDIGGAHGITAVNLNLNDYVNEARARVENGTATDRDRALALEDGKSYSFDFYYMERHGYGANMRIATNIKVTDPSMQTEKNAYQNGEQLNYGGIVTLDSSVEYGFKLTNNGNTTLYHLSFNDNDIHVNLNENVGLSVGTDSVTGQTALNQNGERLTVGDLKLYYTDAGGSTTEVVLQGDQNEALKSYLRTLNDAGLGIGCSLEIRGIYYKISEKELANGKFVNTLLTTAQDNAGTPLNGRDDMSVYVPTEPIYYQWRNHEISVGKEEFIRDINDALLDANNPLHTQLGDIKELDVSKVKAMGLCTSNGYDLTSSIVSVSNNRVAFNYPQTGTHLFYVKLTYDLMPVIVPVQVNVLDVKDQLFVLDYGLKANLTQGNGTVENPLLDGDTLSVASRNTSHKLEGFDTTAPYYKNNRIYFGSTGDLSGVYTISPKNSSQVLDLFNESTSNNATFGLWEPNGNANQQFAISVTKVESGWIYCTIQNVSSGKYLWMVDQKLKQTSYLDEESDLRMSWALQEQSDGSYRIWHRDYYLSSTTDSDGNVTFNGFDAATCEWNLNPVAGSVSYGNFNCTDTQMIYEPTRFMEGADSGYTAIRVHEGNASSSSIGSIDINKEVEMYKRVTVLPASVVYYEDDFPAITYFDSNGTAIGATQTANNIIADGTSGGLTQSVDNSEQYGHDGTYAGTSDFTKSGNSVHKITITSHAKAASFEFKGTGFEMISRTNAYDSATIYLKVLDANGTQVKLIPVITEFDNNADAANDTDTEEIYQVPVVRVDDLAYGKYTVEIWGVPAYDYSTNPPTPKNTVLYLDGIRIYNPLGTDNLTQNYQPEEQGATFAGIHQLLTGAKAAVVTYDSNTLAIGTGTSTFTENRNNANFIEGNVVDTIGEYVMVGPNNGVYLNGTSLKQALVLYVKPQNDASTLQIGLQLLNEGKFFGWPETTNTVGSVKYGVLKQDGSLAWTVLDDHITSGTEQYYTIDYTKCPMEGDAYRVVLYVERGLISFTNLKYSGLDLVQKNGSPIDLEYQGGILVEKTTDENGNTVYRPITDPTQYCSFPELKKQMHAVDTISIAEPDKTITIEGKPAAFTDLENKWYAGEATAMKEMNIIKGYEDGSFRGDESITRAEFAAMLVRAFGLQAPDAYRAPFTDIDSTWATEEITAAAACGIVKGLTESTFGPEEKLSREQMMVMIYRAAQYKEIALSHDVDFPAFPDGAQISFWAEDAVRALVESGLVKGNEAGMLEPLATCTRAQCVAVLYRLLTVDAD